MSQSLSMKLLKSVMPVDWQASFAGKLLQNQMQGAPPL